MVEYDKIHYPLPLIYQVIYSLPIITLIKKDNQSVDAMKRTIERLKDELIKQR
jgi:hypothetical protein